MMRWQEPFRVVKRVVGGAYPELTPKISFSMPMWLVGKKMKEGYVAISASKNHFSMDKLKVASIATHVADSKTCLLHPASHTHRQLTDGQLEEAGIAPDLIRLSVGIENVENIIEDLKPPMA